MVEADLIIFDKDGTLVDLHGPWGGWAEEVAAALTTIIPPERFLARLGWDRARGRIAPETPLAIATLPSLRAAVATWLYDAGLGWSTAVATADAAIAAAAVPVAPPICDLLPLFETLAARGVKLAVVTNDDRDGVERELGPPGLLPYLSAIVGADAGLPAKPAPDAVLSVCATTGVPPERTVVVGDSVADMVMGRTAGVALTVGVLSGSGTAEVLTPQADVLLPVVCALADGE